MFDPSVDVTSDIAAMNAGNFTRVGEDIIVNGRTYGWHPDTGVTFPKSVPGVVPFNRLEFGFIKNVNGKGLEAALNEVLQNTRDDASNDRQGSGHVGEMLMIGCSVYLKGDQSALFQLAQHLRIPAQNVFPYGQITADFTFYDRHENSMKFAVVTGDFDFMCELGLFDLANDFLIEQFRLISATGLVLATPDEYSQSPCDYIVFENGHKEAIELLQDDLLEEVRIHRPANKALRA